MRFAKRHALAALRARAVTPDAPALPSCADPANSRMASAAIICPMMGGRYDAVPKFDRSRRSAPSRGGTFAGCSQEYKTRRWRIPRLRASLRITRHNGQFTVCERSANRGTSRCSLLTAPMLLISRSPRSSANFASASFADTVSMASTT